MIRNNAGFIAVGAIILALVVGLIFLIPAMIKETNEWNAWCAAQGGRVDSSTSTTTGTVINPANGQPSIVTGTTTTYYCISDKGIIGTR